MTPDRHERLADLFRQACVLPKAQRADYLAAACDDDQMRREVELLLAHDDAPLDCLQTETQPSPRARDETASSSSDPWASRSGDHGRFLPGTVLAKRYRIVSMLGRGGMGEVYRADDLALGQSVALKFLPVEFAKDPKRLARFRNEVRVARQVSHPNVCRVYDLGEIDGQYFLSMEYIDGEDLATVLRRMGRPSREKAVEIAQ